MKFLYFGIIVVVALGLMQFITGRRELPTVPEPTLRCSSTERAVSDAVVARLGLTEPVFAGQKRLTAAMSPEGTMLDIEVTCATTVQVEDFAVPDKPDLTGALDVTGSLSLRPEGAEDGACTDLPYAARVAYRLEMQGGGWFFIADLQSFALGEGADACPLVPATE